MTEIFIKNDCLSVDGKKYKCAFGKDGFTVDKTEGDNKTPIGTWKLRRLFWRSDKVSKPETALDCVEMTPDMGWSDDSKDSHYNTLIHFPYAYSAEHLWRNDDVYDIVVELGYNDDPVIAGKGSAIFFHIARDSYTSTEGCIAVNFSDMVSILKVLDTNSVMVIT